MKIRLDESVKADAPIQRWPMNHLNNVGMTLVESARRLPDALAVAAADLSRRRGEPVYREITFAELNQRSDCLAAGILASGIQPGTRLALLVPQGIEFVTWVFALFKAGVVVILIDPGMGRKNMVECLAESRPQGFIGVTRAHVARWLFRRRFPEAQFNVVVDRNWFPGCISQSAILQRGRNHLGDRPFETPTRSREEPAAIIFTTGSTGPPKGVLYRHRVFLEQARQIRDYFEIPPGTVDVSGFPLFALFNAGMGATTIFPRMDATRPAEIDPRDFQHAVERYGANQSFGSPALWNTVSRYCVDHGIRLDSLRRILSAGAPVPDHVLKRIRQMTADDGEIYTPYGATESLPVACISATEILGETAGRSKRGAGTCVGRAFPDMTWKIIRITDEPIPTMERAEPLEVGEIGELIVRGDVVTEQYVTRTSANAEHKIQDGDHVWHRMGDVGYLDNQGRFWFCGRKSHRVQTEHGDMFTVPCEGIINSHPHVYRSALVGVGPAGHQTPVVVVEPWPEHWPETEAARAELVAELTELASAHETTRAIQQFLLRRKLPVDIRHNSKIFREQLCEWAAQQIR